MLVALFHVVATCIASRSIPVVARVGGFWSVIAGFSVVSSSRILVSSSWILISSSRILVSSSDMISNESSLVVHVARGTPVVGVLQ